MGNHFTYLQSLKNGTSKPVDKKKVKAIAPRSKKRIKEDVKYRKIVSELAEKSNECEVKSPVCTFFMQGLQHIVKRSPNNLTDRKNLLRCCNSCQMWIELNPSLSIELGYSKSKFTKYYKRARWC